MYVIMKSVRKKILAGYLIILILMVGVGGLVFMKLSEFTGRVDDLSNNLSRKLTYSKDIATHTALARVYAEAYIFGGSTSDLNEFNRLMRQLEKNIQLLENKSSTTHELTAIGPIKTAVKNYTSAFSGAARLIETRQKLVFGKLNENKFNIENKLSALRVAVSTSNDLKAFLSFGNAQDAFLRMLLYTTEYNKNGDERFGVMYDKVFKNALASFELLEEHFSNSVDRKNARQAQEAVIAYNEGFNEIRKDFRKQTALINTIFNTLEPVISESVARLVLDIEQQYQTHNIQSKTILVNTRNKLFLFTLVAVLFGLVTGLTLSRKITGPLHEVMKTSKQIAEEDLKILTSQLTSLAEGDVRLRFKVKSLPLKVASRDEVGETARAFNQIIYQLLEAEKAFADMSAYLNKMTETAHAISKGDLSVKLKQNSDHDILCGALSLMTENLAAARAEVAGYQNHLEELVQKRTDELDENRRLLFTLMANLPGMAYRCLNDKNWKMVFVSQGVLELTGYEPKNLINSRDIAYGELIHPDDRERVWQEAQDALSRFAPFVMQYRIITKKKDIKWVWEKGRGIFSHNQELIALEGFISDITERKLAEESLRQAHKMEAIGTLAGGIAHDFNNMLAIILGNAELALIDIPEGNQAAGLIEQILTASLRAKDMVQKLLRFSRKTPESRKPIQITRIVNEVLGLLRKTIPATIDIRTNILCQSEMIQADQTEISQVVMNLCMNASHAIGKEPGIMEVSLETITLDHLYSGPFKDLPPGDYARLKVKDNGIGMKPDVLERVWEPYFTTKEVDEGLGMGLAVVHGIVKKHEGGIHADSEYGKGTTFEAVFPLIESQSEADIKKTDSLPTGMERILFVDDEPPIVEMTKLMLESSGYKVLGKTGSLNALTAFKERPAHFDLVITDMAMPDMSGDRLAVELMKIRPDIPVILCTGYSKTICDKTASKIGIKAFIHKPIVKADLAKTVRRVLDNAKREA